MAKLSIKTEVDTVYIVGEFCCWIEEWALRADRQAGAKLIHVDKMPKGEYRVLSSDCYKDGEVYPTDGRQMGNRYFSGDQDEKIYCYFRR